MVPGAIFSPFPAFAYEKFVPPGMMPTMQIPYIIEYLINFGIGNI